MAVSGSGFAQDLLTRIINVHWGGATVFILGTSLGNILYRVKFKSTSDTKPAVTPISLPEPTSTDEGTPPGEQFPLWRTVGGSYRQIVQNEGTPQEKKISIFVVCGYSTIPRDISHEGNEFTVFDYHSRVYTSNNGLRWDLTKSQDAVRNDNLYLEILQNSALVWDPDTKKFYYDGFHSLDPDLHSPGGEFKQEEVFSSADGRSWAMVSETPIGVESYRSTYPELYCTQNDCVDDLGNHAPDGVMGTMKVGDETITARPSDPGLFDNPFGRDLTDESPAVEIISSNTGARTVTLPGFLHVKSVAAVNGILLAVGYSSQHDGLAAYSLDKGRTWVRLPDMPIDVDVVIGGDVK